MNEIVNTEVYCPNPHKKLRTPKWRMPMGNLRNIVRKYISYVGYFPLMLPSRLEGRKPARITNGTRITSTVVGLGIASA